MGFAQENPTCLGHHLNIFLKKTHEHEHNCKKIVILGTSIIVKKSLCIPHVLLHRQRFVSRQSHGVSFSLPGMMLLQNWAVQIISLFCPFWPIPPCLSLAVTDTSDIPNANLGTWLRLLSTGEHNTAHYKSWSDFLIPAVIQPPAAGCVGDIP